MSRNIVAGSVRLCYAVVYAIFLGFGLAIGNRAFEKIYGTAVFAPEDYTCDLTHISNGPWYQRTPSKFWGMYHFFRRCYADDIALRSIFDRSDVLIILEPKTSGTI